MSKMFDALRRAELLRKQRNEQARNPERPVVERVPLPRLAPNAPMIAPEPGPAEPSTNGHREFSDVMFREMGILQNSVDTVLGKKPNRTLLFTSSTHEEGTTTVAMNFARLLAMNSDERVLVIEMNTRTPSLFWRLGLKKPEGVTHFMSGGVPLSAVVQPAPGKDFDVIHAGEPEPARVQLNLEREFGRLVTEAHRSYDTVIVDAPPVVGSPETPPMSGAVDGVVLVVRCERTKREIVQRSIRVIEQMNGNALGVVLNRKKYYIPEFIYNRI